MYTAPVFKIAVGFAQKELPVTQQPQNTTMDVRIQTMQFGQPYQLGQTTLIAEEDGVHFSLLSGGQIFANIKLSPEEAFDIAKRLSESAHKAHVARLRGSDEKVTLSSILALGKKRL
jgi:hypothetical protein